MRALLAFLVLTPLAACATISGAGRAAAPAIPAPTEADRTDTVRSAPRPGAEVRFVFPAAGAAPVEYRYGQLQRMAGDTVVMVWEFVRGRTTYSRLDTLILGGGRQLQVVAGRHGNGRTGFFLGFLVGMGVGGAIGSNCTASSGFVPNLCPLAVVSGLVGGGFLGGGVGWVIGKLILIEDWRTVPVGAVRSRPGSIQVGLRTSF